jgi:hypothetical protein
LTPKLFKARFLGLVLFAALAAVWPVASQAAGPTGGAAGFAVLADSTGLTCTNSTVTGAVGVATSSTAVTNTGCTMPSVQVASGAYANFLNIYNGIASSLGHCTMLTGTLAGMSLGAGTYCFPAAAALTGTLTLTGSGPWLFEVGTGGTGALTATNFTIVGGNPCNATWWVRQAVTLSTSAFQGTVLAGTDITLTDTSLTGRLLAKGAVTMTRSHIVGCTGAIAGGRHHHKKNKQHCNQGVGNGPEGCDPGNSNHKHGSNDENGGTPGDPGRQGGGK